MCPPHQNREKAAEYGELQKTAEAPHERREFQKLAQSFTVLAENEEWLADNQAKIIHGPDPALTDGQPLAQEDDVPLAQDDDHILRCLGAAVILQWNTLPRKLRRELFDNAGSMGDVQEPALRGRIARFLHKHKDDGYALRCPDGAAENDASPAAIEQWDNEGGASSQSSRQAKIKNVRKDRRPASTNGRQEEWQWRSAD
jgi:hypothetical protein